ncbi:29471_t:CDS:2 [Gigaspora margarita]|uniref:29471_t:CDS:1 n=1 Tax=Gigaspora margarita TaxID=4874 RepID=A0ABN7VDM7_GIGMA|nr:29471_t:CDS:2 [Gigaspora margarita]
MPVSVVRPAKLSPKGEPIKKEKTKPVDSLLKPEVPKKRINSYQNDREQKMKTKKDTFKIMDDPKNPLDDVRNLFNHGCDYQNEVENKNIAIRAGKNESKAHVSHPKIPLLRYHEKDESTRSYGRSKLKGIEVKGEELTDSCKTLEATCMAWKMKVETFKTRMNANKKKDVNIKGLNEACKSWMLKVENIKHVKSVKTCEK